MLQITTEQSAIHGSNLSSAMRTIVFLFSFLRIVLLSAEAAPKASSSTISIRNVLTVLMALTRILILTAKTTQVFPHHVTHAVLEKLLLEF